VSNTGPYTQDVLTQIYNVHWDVGTVFVFGTEIGNNLYYVKFKDKTDKTPQFKIVTLPDEPPANYEPNSLYFTTIGCSYHLVGKDEGKPNEKKKPTFLVCGYRVVPHFIDDGSGNMVTAFNYHSLVYTSPDGLKWFASYQREVVRDDFETIYRLTSVALVWNPPAKRFYFDQFYSSIDRHTGIVYAQTENIFGSLNGDSWGLSSSADVVGDSSYVSQFPSYCTHNDCVDENEQHVPDGNMGNDAGTGIVARPKESWVYIYWFGIRGYSVNANNSVEIKQKGATVTVFIPGIDRVTCVAAADGILMAGGFVKGVTGAVAFSLDNGETWTKFQTTPDPVVAMVAAPATDVSG
jgi:hypothetical protein